MLRIAGIATIAALAVWAPLWTYAISLLLFGLPHVLVELRYVDERFGRRLPRSVVLGLGAALAGIVLVRVLGVASFGDPRTRTAVELFLGMALLIGIAPLLRTRPVASGLGFGVAAALLIGVVYAPFIALVTLALLHNLTPVGFLAERLRGAERTRALLWAGFAFAIVPAVLLSAPICEPLRSGPLSTGELSQHLHAFVPGPLLGGPIAERLFATAAYLQCMHYVVVLGVLPRLGAGPGPVRTVVPWPSRRTFAAGVAALAVVATLGFALDFAGTRAGYAVVAALHAWIEIPVLVLACASIRRVVRPVTA